MPFLQKMFECSVCGTILNIDENSGSWLPCSKCRSTSLKPITDIKEQLLFRAKATGTPGKPDLEIKIADDLHKDTSEWRQLKMTIDRISDSYEKKVINPETDEELYSNKEPLSHHQGRGSAKPKSKGSARKGRRQLCAYASDGATRVARIEQRGMRGIRRDLGFRFASSGLHDSNVRC